MTPGDKEKLPGLMARSGCFLIGCGCLIPVVFVVWLLVMGGLFGGK